MQIQTPANNDFANAENERVSEHGLPPRPWPEVVPVLITQPHFCRRYGVGKTTAYRLLNLRDPQNAAIRSLKLGTKRLIEVRSADAYFAGLLSAQNEGGRQ